MLKKTITAVIAVSAALTFCGCKAGESSDSKSADSKSSVSSAVTDENISAEISQGETAESLTEGSSAESADTDKSAVNKLGDVSCTDSTSEENPNVVTAISMEDQPDIQTETGIVIVTENSTPAITSAQDDTADETFEINFGDGDEFELPIVPADP